MIARLASVIAALALCSALALADPAFRMRYPAGVPRAEIEGDWSSSRYQVWRSSSSTGPWVSLTDADVLCLGSCYADDFDAAPGVTYWYRFVLTRPEGGTVSFGPYAATISPTLARRIGATVSPNPGRGATRVTLALAGAPGAAPVAAEAAVFDLQGRRVALLHRGPLPAGSTTLSWDGRGAAGEALGAGVYLLRFATSDGRSSVTRVIRAR